MNNPNARDLHHESIIIDGLNASNFFDPRVFPRLFAGGITAVNATVAAWHTPEEAVNLMANLLNVIAERSDILMQARSVADIRAAKASGRVGVIAGFQGAEPIGANLNMLKLYHALGVRIIQLTYNFRNLIGCGCQEPEDTGLSAFGREAIAEMNRLGMIVDVSHVSADVMRHAIATSAAPVMFSHSSARAICDVPRNVPDDVLQLLPANGGLCMVTFVASFVSPASARWSPATSASGTISGPPMICCNCSTSSPASRMASSIATAA